MAENEKTGRLGRKARWPSAISWSGWKDILWRVKNQIGRDNLSVIAGGVSFFTFLSIFPALAAMVSIYALVTDPVRLQEHITRVQVVLPPEAAQLVNRQLQRLVESRSGDLGWSLAVGMVIALWSAARGMGALITALTVAYGANEDRGFLRLNALALLLTFAGIAFVTFFLFLIVGIPVALNAIDLGDEAATSINFSRWLLLAAGGIFSMGVIFRYAPNRSTPNWQWLTWGALIATALWLFGSSLFSYYVTHFSTYNAVYGSLGVVVILMMWLLLSVYCILLGAEINAAIEHQTTLDKTAGESEPIGDRGAHVPDSVGRKTG